MATTHKTPLVRLLGIAIFVSLVHLPGAAIGEERNMSAKLDPPQGSRQDMMGDLVLQRPFGLANTLVGIGTWVVALPFTIFSGSVGDSGQKLVVEPAAHTFIRPLGYPRPVSPDR